MKKMIAWLILFLCLAFAANGQAPLSVSQKLEDISYLEGALLHAHPSAGRYTPVDQLSALARSLREEVRTRRERFSFRMGVARLVSRMHCIHTSLLSGRRWTKRDIRKNGLPPVLPVRTYYDGRALWISDVFLDSLKMIRGMRIDRIDGRPAAQVMETLMQYRSGDGYSQSFMEALINRGARFSVLYQSAYNPDTVVLVSGRLKGSTVSARIPFRKMRIPVYRKKVDAPIFVTPNHLFSIDSTSGAGVLRIASFNPQRGVRKFYRRVFTYLGEHRVRDLVIDLRDNSGGNIREARLLLSYLMDTTVFYTLEKRKSRLCRYGTFMSNYYAVMDYLKRRFFSFARRYRIGKRLVIEQKRKARKKHRFDGRVFVLQDGYTASSSSLVSSFLDKYADAVIVGSESGGGAAGNNGLFYARSKLPNSRIRVRLPQYWLNYHLMEDRGRGVVPDIPVSYTIRDIMQRRDLETEVVRSIIKKNKS